MKFSAAPSLIPENQRAVTVEILLKIGEIFNSIPAGVLGVALARDLGIAEALRQAAAAGAVATRRAGVFEALGRQVDLDQLIGRSRR